MSSASSSEPSWQPATESARRTSTACMASDQRLTQRHAQPLPGLPKPHHVVARGVERGFDRSPPYAPKEAQQGLGLVALEVDRDLEVVCLGHGVTNRDRARPASPIGREFDAKA